MNKLAADAVRAVHVLVKLLTKPRLIPRCDVPLFLQLVLTVSERACVAVGTALRAHPALAQLRLNFQFVISRHDAAVSAERERIVLVQQRPLVMSSIIRQERVNIVHRVIIVVFGKRTRCELIVSHEFHFELLLLFDLFFDAADSIVQFVLAPAVGVLVWRAVLL